MRKWAAALMLPVAAFAAGQPEDDVAAGIAAMLAKNAVTDWAGVEKMPKVAWAGLPPKDLPNCLPDGGCYTRQGAAVFGDRKLVAIATGARTIVSNIYLRNVAAPIGEAAVLAALKSLGFEAALSRCPLPGTPGGTNWFKLTGGANVKPGVLSVQTSCNGKPCEGFALSIGPDLPQLQPAQLRMYTEQCSAPVSERKPVSTALPHELLAKALAGFLTAAPYDWKALEALPTGVQMSPGSAKKGDLTFKNDANPWMHTGSMKLAGREFSLLFSGTPAQVKVVYLDEGGLHPKGEHMLGELYKLGFQVKLARCGPVYTESTNNWYAITSANARPAMLKQSIRYDGARVQDAYELRMDGTLPARDPRDRDPGAGGCR